MEIKTEFLVIGSGIAGISFALKVAEFGEVALVTKKEAVNSNTNLAQGGIAAVLSKDDSFAMHVQDTLKSGAGLCNESIVRMVVENGPARVAKPTALNRSPNGSASPDPTRHCR